VWSEPNRTADLRAGVINSDSNARSKKKMLEKTDRPVVQSEMNAPENSSGFCHNPPPDSGKNLKKAMIKIIAQNETRNPHVATGALNLHFPRTRYSKTPSSQHGSSSNMLGPTSSAMSANKTTMRLTDRVKTATPNKT
jgi:hypothetical protein